MIIQSSTTPPRWILAMGIAIAVGSSGAAGCGATVEFVDDGTKGDGGHGATTDSGYGASTSSTGGWTNDGAGATSSTGTGASTNEGCPGGGNGSGGGPPCPDWAPSNLSPCPMEGQCCDYSEFYCDHSGGGGDTWVTTVYTCSDGVWHQSGGW